MNATINSMNFLHAFDLKVVMRQDAEGIRSKNAMEIVGISRKLAIMLIQPHFKRLDSQVVDIRRILVGSPRILFLVQKMGPCCDCMGYRAWTSCKASVQLACECQDP